MSDGPVERVRPWLSAAHRVTVLTGAGISTSSGIPDYRGPNGVWTKDPSKMRLVDIDAYLAEAEVRREAWQERLDHPAWTAAPNDGHLALVELERQGKLRALITQNIDGLHQAAGSTPGKLLELHGTIHRCRCLECGHETSMRSQLDRVEAGEPDPPCERCGGIQRSATVAFGQQLDAGVLRRATEASSTCDLFLAVGTSLHVAPAGRLPVIAIEASARLVIVNSEATAFDSVASAVIRCEISQVLPRLISSRGPAPR
jgi:NAD-dependent deacetylase